MGFGYDEQDLGGDIADKDCYDRERHERELERAKKRRSKGGRGMNIVRVIVDEMPDECVNDCPVNWDNAHQEMKCGGGTFNDGGWYPNKECLCMVQKEATK